MTILLLVGGLLAALLVVRHRSRCREGHPHGAGRRDGALHSRGSARQRTLLLLVGVLLALQAAVAAPALAQNPFGDCKEAPNPERPGSGMVGAIDPTPVGHGQPGSVYSEVGYAGVVWHTYDLGCGPSGIRDPDAVIGNWTGNQLFNVAKALVGATNGLHYALADDGLLAPLDDLIVSGTVALYDSVYAPWFGLIAVLLAIVLFRYIWRGDLATVSKRAIWALAGIWLAAATYLTPLLYTQVLDDVLVDGSEQIRTGFLDEVGIEGRDALPTLLYEQIIYTNWLRGVFGSPDGPQATELGRDLVRAQAYTKQEIANGADDPDSGVEDRKKREYQQIAERTGSAYGYFQGVDGSRIGTGFLAMLQATMFALFQLLALGALLLAQVLLRVVILVGPVLGLIAILYHELLRGVGRAVGAALLNVIVISALTALHTLVMVWVFNPALGLSVLSQMLLAGLVTLVMLLIARPVRRMWQMVELSASAVGGALPAAPSGVLSRLRRRRHGVEPTAADRFWDEARETDPDPATPPTTSAGRARPEAAGTVTAVAERLDRGSGSAPAARALVYPAAGPGHPGGGSGTSAALPAGARRNGPVPALPTGFSSAESQRASRITDTVPVVAESSWDRSDEDAVLVPSRSSRGPARTSSRRAEFEVVAGRPAWVVYRPSRGLVVGDDGDGNRSVLD
ncbi:MAG: hypothetical protein GEU83_18075 [Pseudonocardiaceae bacterium]|nr:hypothetical protein [Pseudonocardiaceae bacterium]